MTRTPEESFDGLILEADWADMHGGGHHDDNCEVCRDIANVRTAFETAAVSQPAVRSEDAISEAQARYEAQEPWPAAPLCCQCEACQRDQFPHASDCAVHNGPAMPVGSCTCRGIAQAPPMRTACDACPDPDECAKRGCLIHSAQAVQVPVDITGWKLVPDDPTEAMWQAGRTADLHPGDSYSKVWRAMWNAAPDVEDCETTSTVPSAEGK